MPTIHDQVKLEKQFIEQSATKYYLGQDNLRKKKQSDKTDSVRYVMAKGIEDSAEILKKIVETQVRGVGAKYNQLVKLVAARVDETTGELYYDYKAVVYIGLTILFRSMSDQRSVSSFTMMKAKLAKALESDAKARLFEAAYPGYYFTVMKSLEEQGVTQYEHTHKVIMTKFRDFELEWSSWSIQETNAVAGKILNAMLVAMHQIIFKQVYKVKNKTHVTITTTVAADDWFASYEQERGLLEPTLPPMIIKPINWSADEEGNITGGYTTPRMCSALPFVKARHKRHEKYVRAHTPTEHIKAVNKIQSTPWRINTKTLELQKTLFKNGNGAKGLPRFKPLALLDFPETLKDIPVELLTEKQKEEVLEWKKAQKGIYTANRLNRSKVIAYKTTFDGATDYSKYERFYFVYNTDFRGRVYCATSGLSPQGNDTSKSLLQFADGLPIGTSGLRWLAIHGANVYGHDKVSNDDREHWIRSMEPALRSINKSPQDTRDLWESADKPWQFIAFVFEWARTDYGRNKNTISYIPVGLDGSCNGIQHYSAILRDSIGGNGVNLIDRQVPSDIYQDVANELVRLLKSHHSTSSSGRLWIAADITRKLTKQPVMTLPYGSTQQSAKLNVLAWVLEHKEYFVGLSDKECLGLANFVTPILWKAIENVVIAARLAMVWLKKETTKVLNQHNEPLSWISPAGFPVYQPYWEMKKIRVRSMLLGDISIDAEGTIEPNSTQESTTYEIPTDKVDKTRQRSGIAPNFIHSVDASHMVKTVNACNIKHFAMIHDDFGTHAANTQELWTVIREQFYDMYKDSNPLEQWQVDQNLDNPSELPQYGDLDIADVLESTYFFG